MHQPAHETQVPPHVAALVSAIEAGPRRAAPDKYLGFFLEKEAPAAVRAVLRVWASHAVRELRIGTLVMDDRYIWTSLELPYWEKDGRGPHADCTIVRDRVREDALVIGSLGFRPVFCDLGVETLVALCRDTNRIEDRTFCIEGPQNIHAGETLEMLLSRHHREALEAGLPTALAPFL